MPSVAIARATAAAIGTPSTPQRVDSDMSAIATTVAVLGCSNSRTTSGEKLVSDDCAQSIDEKRSPACQSRRPMKSKPDPCERLRWSPMRHLAHPLQDHQLDLGDVGQVDQRRDRPSAAPHRPHGIGTRSTTSWMTASVVRPWLAACGPSQMRWLRMYGASSWMSSG